VGGDGAWWRRRNGDQLGGSIQREKTVLAFLRRVMRETRESESKNLRGTSSRRNGGRCLSAGGLLPERLLPSAEKDSKEDNYVSMGLLRRRKASILEMSVRGNGKILISVKKTTEEYMNLRLTGVQS